MLDALRRTSSFFFYLLGSTVLVFIYLVSKQFVGVWAVTFLNTLDLPLLLVGMVYAGSSLYGSLVKDGRFVLPLFLGITLPLFVIFGLCVYFNFGLAFAEF